MREAQSLKPSMLITTPTPIAAEIHFLGHSAAWADCNSKSISGKSNRKDPGWQYEQMVNP
ncbi:hypothetical protein CsSME_00029401 [Camellia sinensis var. sinensis]